MAKPDIEAIKAKAKLKIADAKGAATTRKAYKANPMPKYVEMPEPTGDAEVDSLADLDAVQLGFRKRAADEGKRFALATDSEYWGVLCFQTREQRNAFFSALGIDDLASRYINGEEIAKKLGIELPEAAVPYKTSSKPDPAWVEFVK